MSVCLKMLGTGSAFPKHSYNTCFVVSNVAERLLVDAGGGNGILTELNNAGIAAGDLHNMFITHSHTDHILGAVWVIRSVINKARENRFEGKLNLYGNPAVQETVDVLCRMTLLKSHYDIYKEVTNVIITDNNTVDLCGARTEFFDVGSKNVMQTGFKMTFRDGSTFACLGDESLTEENSCLVAGCDTLMCGAFCRYADRAVFKPYEKHHHTVKDVAQLAEIHGIKKLILVHCEDGSLTVRAEQYADEASRYYTGELFVPVDGETIEV